MKAMAVLQGTRTAPSGCAALVRFGSVPRVLVGFFFLLFSLVLLEAPACGQTFLAPGDTLLNSHLPTFNKDVQEVNLILTVRNKRGRFVRNLNPKDFSILDNDLPPEKITFFQRETDLPLRVALVIDTSDSVTHRFKFEQESAARFFKKILRPTTDLGLVVGFNQRAHVAQRATNDPRKLREGLDRLQIGGETAVYDAVRLAAQQLMKIRDTQPNRRAIVVISDGEDNRSKIGLQQAIDAALHADTAIYVLTTNPRTAVGFARKGDSKMTQLAESTGGRLLRADEDDDVRNAFSKVAEELRSQYAIGYRPVMKDRDGLFHHLIVTGPKKLRIYHRLGYFAR